MSTRWRAWGCGLIVPLLLSAGAPREATACFDNDDWLGPCGPALALPPWGTGAWGAPEYYSTIQTADLDGDGTEELLGRGPMGLVLHKLDLDNGLWLPVPDAYHPAVERKFSDRNSWDRAYHYATIQTADLDGDKQAEVLARGPNGMVVYQYDPSTKTWKELAGDGPFANDDCFSNGRCWWESPSYYTTIQTADLDGDGKLELLGRGGDGIEAYRWTGSGWTKLADIAPREFIDRGGWTVPEYYTTIQTADIDGDGRAELLGRAGGGILAYTFDGSSWSLLSRLGPFSNRCGWHYPQYYLTIQAADIDGDKQAELLGRSGLGMVAYKWFGEKDGWKQMGQEAGGCQKGTGPFPGKHEAPQYYFPIQTADLDGDGKVELLGRLKDGMEFYRWDGSGWSEISALHNSPQLEDTVGDLILWEAAPYYATIQTGDVDGDGKAELLARGVSGMRTWHLVDGKWQPYPTTATTNAPNGHGYPDPPFPTAGQVKAYKALGQYLGVPNNDVRTNDTNGYGNPKVSANSASYQDWNNFLSTLQTQTCNNNPINGDNLPPQYKNCTPQSGVDQEDWDTVVNAIIAELWYVTNAVTGYRDNLEAVQNELFDDKEVTFDAIIAPLKLAIDKNTAAGVNYLGLGANIIEIVGDIGDAAGPEVGLPLSILGDVLGSIAGLALPRGGASVTFEQKVSEVVTAIADSETAQDQPGAQFDFIRTDHTLLRLFGEWMTEQPAKAALWQVNVNAYKSAARKGFATWVYQMFLPLFWDLWVITNCNPRGRFVGCIPPPHGPYIVLHPVGNGEVDFTGVLPKQNACNPGLTNPGIDWSCQWHLPAKDIQAKLWGDDTCSWSPNNPDRIWEYGTCNLGLPTDANSPIFNNWNGWKFTTRSGNPVPSDAAVAGRVPIAAEDGRLRATALFSLPDDLDLSTVSVLIDRLLHEEGGLGELARGPAGDPVDLEALLATRASQRHAVFETWPGVEPRMRLKLRQRRGRLEADLRVDRVSAHDPALCTGVPPATELWTGITIDDGFNPPLPLQAVTEWECLETPEGEGVLRAR